MAGTFASIFEAIYDFVVGGGLKKTVIGLMVLSLIAVSGAYLVYPQTTTSVALSAIGATPEGQFEPPAIEGDTVEYVGEFSGSGGPTGVPIGGEIEAEVNFDSGEVSAVAEGENHISEGFLEGEVDSETGNTWGVGSVNAFGLAGVSFSFEGEYAQDGSYAEGTWEATGEISGSGTWHIERVDDEGGEIDVDVDDEDLEELE